MSHQTGIKANEKLKKFFSSYLDLNVRVFKVSIENEELVLSHFEPVKDSWNVDFDKLVPPLVEPAQPAYILYRLDTKNETTGYDWLLISWSPDDSAVRQKMLFASTKATLKQEFGSGQIKEEYHATSLDEVCLKSLERHRLAVRSPAPLTTREEELVELRKSETTGLTEISVDSRSQTLSGVSFPLLPDAMTAIEHMAQKKVNYAQFKIDNPLECLSQFNSAPTFRTVCETNAFSKSVKLEVTIPHSVPLSRTLNVTCQLKQPVETPFKCLDGVSYRDEKFVALNHNEFSKLRSMCFSTVGPSVSSSVKSNVASINSTLSPISSIDSNFVPVNPTSNKTTDKCRNLSLSPITTGKSENSDSSLCFNAVGQTSRSSEPPKPIKAPVATLKRKVETDASLIPETSKKHKIVKAAVNQSTNGTFQERLEARSRIDKAPNASSSISKLSQYVQQISKDNNNIDVVQGTLILELVLKDILSLKSKNISISSEAHKSLIKSLLTLINIDEALINDKRNFVSKDCYHLVMLSANAVFIAFVASYSKTLHYEDTVISHLVQFIYIHFFNSLLPVIQKSHNKADPLSIVNFDKVFGTHSFQNFGYKFVEIMYLLSTVPEIVSGDNDSFSKLVHICTSSLFAPNIVNLQHACLKLITFFFTTHEDKQKIILDKIISTIALLNAETNFIALSYVTNQSNIKIQFFTAALLNFVNRSGNYLRHASNANCITDLYQVNIRNSQRLFNEFLNIIISNSLHSTNFKKVLENFISDLLQIRCQPEWPACNFFFRCLFKLIHFYSEKELSNKPLQNVVFNIYQLCLPELRNDFMRQSSVINELTKIVGDQPDGASSTPDLTSMVSGSSVCGLKLVIQLLLRCKNSKSLGSLIEFYCTILIEEIESNIRKLKLNRKLKPVQKQCNKLFSFIYETSQTLKDYRSINTEFKPELSPHDTTIVKTVCRYLNSSNPFVSNYSQLLMIISKEALNDNSQVQLKALKCIFSVADADPTVLFNKYVEVVVSKALNHGKAGIREMTTNFLSKHIFTNENILKKFFNKKALAGGISDISMSVRKATLKIYCKLILDYPNYPTITDIILKLLLKLNDEPAIVKIIVNSLKQKWIDELNKNESKLVEPIVNEIVSVLKLSKEFKAILLFQKLFSLFVNDTDSSLKLEDSISAFKKMIQYILNLVSTENIDATFSINCYHLLLIIVMNKQDIASTLCNVDLYQHLRCKLKKDTEPQILGYVLSTLKCLILSTRSLFEDKDQNDTLIKSLIPIINSGSPIVTFRSVSCFFLVSEINNDYSYAKDLFCKYRNRVLIFYNSFKVNEEKCVISDAQFCRALFNLATFIKSFNVLTIYEESVMSNIVEIFVFLLLKVTKLRSHILVSFGLICLRFDTLLLRNEVVDLLNELLQKLNHPTQLKVDVLKTLHRFFLDTNYQSKVQNDNWSETSKTNSLKEMKDVSAGIPSIVAQRYIKSILSCYQTSNKDLRITATKTLSTIVEYSLVHPKNFLSHCICMLADQELVISETASRMLTSIQSLQPTLIRPYCLDGMIMSVQLELALTNEVLRGFTLIRNKPTAKFSQLYKLSSEIKNQNNFVASLLSKFSEDNPEVLLYLADNLAHFLYEEIKDVSSLLMQISAIIFNTAIPIFENIQEVLAEDAKRKRRPILNEKNKSAKRVIEPSENDFSLPSEELSKLCKSGHSKILLLHLLNFLKSVYKISEDLLLMNHVTLKSSKLKKVAVRKSDAECFNPKSVIQYLKSEVSSSSQSKENLDKKYLISTLRALNAEYEKLSFKT